MNFIKKSILVILLISVSAASFAQKKKSPAEKRATTATEYIAEKMSLDADKKAFVHEVLVEKFGSNMAQTSGKNLTNEEKKAIYKASNAAAGKKLSEKFTKEEIREINKYQQEANNVGKK